MTQDTASQAEARQVDNALYEKLRRKLSRVHPSNQSPDCPLAIKLTYGEIARLSTAMLAFSASSADDGAEVERPNLPADQFNGLPERRYEMRQLRARRDRRR